MVPPASMPRIRGDRFAGVFVPVAPVVIARFSCVIASTWTLLKPDAAMNEMKHIHLQTQHRGQPSATIRIGNPAWNTQMGGVCPNPYSPDNSASFDLDSTPLIGSLVSLRRTSSVSGE
jgi:hypothetical protein